MSDEPKIGCVNHDCDQCRAVQEPVGEMRFSAIIEGMIVPVVEQELPVGTKLYTTPPVHVKTYHDFEPLPVAPVPDGPYSAPIKELWPVAPKPWVGLSEKDKTEIRYLSERDDRDYVMALVEAKLKEKNHG
jgi:hypothetical protein